MDVFSRLKIRKRRTFDSGATPKPGEELQPPDKLAKVDLEALGTQIKATIEKARADDPAELRKKITALEKQLAAKPPEAAAPAIDEQAIAMRILDAVNDRDRTWLGHVQRFMQAQSTPKAMELVRIAGELQDDVRELRNSMQALIDHPPANQVNLTGLLSELKSKVVHQAKKSPENKAPAGGPLLQTNGQNVPPTKNGELRGGLLAIMTAAVEAEAEGVTAEGLTVITGYKATSRKEYIRQLKGLGYIEQRDGSYFATPPGIDALGSNFKPLPKGDDLQAYWLNKLGGGPRQILSLLIEIYPRAADSGLIEETTQLKATSRKEYVRQLKCRKLVTVDRGQVKASDKLFG